MSMPHFGSFIPCVHLTMLQNLTGWMDGQTDRCWPTLCPHPTWSVGTKMWYVTSGPSRFHIWTHVVTFNVHLTHDLDLGFSRLNFLIAVYRNARAHRHQTKGIWVDRVLYLLYDLQLWPWPWIFKVKFWKCYAHWHGTKGMWVYKMLDSHCDLKLLPHPWPLPWIFKVKFWNCCISGMGGPIGMERKGWNVSTQFLPLAFQNEGVLSLPMSVRQSAAFTKTRRHGGFGQRKKVIASVGPQLIKSPRYTRGDFMFCTSSYVAAAAAAVGRRFLFTR